MSARTVFCPLPGPNLEQAAVGLSVIAARGLEGSAPPCLLLSMSADDAVARTPTASRPARR